MVNKVTLVGNVGRDPELRKLDNGVSVANFSIATNESYKDKSGQWKDLTEWHEIVVWRALADSIETRLKKGMMVYLEGKLTTRTWQDKDGNNRKTTEVVGNFLRIINNRAATNNSTPSSPPSSTPSSNEGESSSSDDMPF